MLICKYTNINTRNVSSIAVLDISVEMANIQNE